MELKHKELSEKIIAAAYNVHKELGYGFLEKVYKKALAVELGEAGLKYAVEFPLKVKYHNIVVGDYFTDIIVDDKIIVEVKAVSKLESVHEVQLVNYLKATGIEVGLLINFGQSVEIKRRIFG
ncbi:MAG: GxxExxY protein [Planctomycetes bacterium]|nr:GxxExxY protein [Planctomycetota bacterium]MBU1518921.1 GxxExxY protein [Planctomycetota bacterium]MBU2457530.1 GxxExxY protein [Planctomycetota bacterium]MBU2596926.1 GxxExxY protein [Planctomycetota bacterium]